MVARYCTTISVLRSWHWMVFDMWLLRRRNNVRALQQQPAAINVQACPHILDECPGFSELLYVAPEETAGLCGEMEGGEGERCWGGFWISWYLWILTHLEGVNLNCSWRTRFRQKPYCYKKGKKFQAGLHLDNVSEEDFRNNKHGTLFPKTSAWSKQHFHWIIFRACIWCFQICVQQEHNGCHCLKFFSVHFHPAPQFE